MATDLNLKWEWPADRQPQFKLVVAVSGTQAADSGWFGIKKSPSLVQGMPDPITLKGTVVKGDSRLQGKTISLTLPKLEADAIGKGDTAALGVLEDDTCICIKKLQSADEDLSHWQC